MRRVAAGAILAKECIEQLLTVDLDGSEIGLASEEELWLLGSGRGVIHGSIVCRIVLENLWGKSRKQGLFEPHNETHPVENFS